jgi:multidrug efflux pump subunit AcrB
MSTMFYRNRRIFALAVMMMLATGLSALTTIGRQEDPTITNLFATVLTPYPGADPARVEALVTEKIETELRKIPEIDEITSVSRTGISVISIELYQFISKARVDQAWSEIRDALSDAARNFPAGVPQPQFDDDRFGAFTAIYALRPAAGNANPAIMRRWAEALQDRLRGVSGTKLVELFGAGDEEVTVTVDTARLTALGLTASSVSRAIAQADAKVRAGQLRGSSFDMLIEVEGELKEVDRVRAIPVKSAGDGRLVRVGDVAEVSRGIRLPMSSIAVVDEGPAILIAARMEDDLQVDAWAERTDAAVEAFAAALPAGIELEPLFDQATYTANRLRGVLGNMALGVALVVAILVLTLGWRSAFIVAVIIPLATLVSIAGLQAVGISIQQMSITGLIVALGLLVDGAIVMTDEIRKRLESGKSRLVAVSESVARLTVPLIASTATTVLAFMPMALLPGPAGDFVGSIAIAVIIMLVVSLVLALTITPALAGWLLPESRGGVANRRFEAGLSLAPLSRLFDRRLRLALRRPLLAIGAALILPVVGFGAFPTLKPQFFPGVDRDQFYVQVKLADGSAISETEKVAARVGEIVKTEPGVARLTWVIGKNAPAFYYNMVGNQDGVASFAEALVKTRSPRATEAILDRLQRRLDAAVPEARVTVRGLVQGPPVEAPVEIRIVGPNLDTLRRLGERVRLIMQGVPGITVTQAQVDGGAPKLKLDVSEEKARLAGLDLGEVAAQMETRLEGMTGGSIVEGSEELPVRVRADDEKRASIEEIAGLDLVASQGASVPASGAYRGLPIAAFGEWTLVPSEVPIRRRNGERINTVQGFVERGILPEQALAQVQDKIAETGLALPAGYRLKVGGDSDARDEVLRNLLGPLGLIVSLTVAVVLITFGSYRLAAVAALVAVMSMGLSLLSLAVLQYPFGIVAVIGVIGSIGVSINAAIIIMTAFQADDGALAGDIDRIASVVMAQGRHIVSTTLTTFGGFLPLILAGGGFWPPFAVSIAGGVLLSTVVSFLFVPPAFALLARFGRIPDNRSTAAASRSDTIVGSVRSAGAAAA